jgi:hypothetical protein
MSAESHRVRVTMGMTTATAEISFDGPHDAPLRGELRRALAFEIRNYREPVQPVPARFVIYGLFDDPIEGVDFGQTWNGWRCPRFQKKSADALVAAYNRSYGTMPPDSKTGIERPCARFDEQTRTYLFYQPDADATDDFTVTVVDGVEWWAIGAFAWCWEIAE